MFRHHNICRHRTARGFTPHVLLATRGAGVYLRKGVPLDTWGPHCTYSLPGLHNGSGFVRHSRDGQPGGTGEIRDVTHW
jgi:hypothetical protein